MLQKIKKSALKQISKKGFSVHNNIWNNPRYYKYFTLGIFAFLLAFISSAALIPISNSNAESTVGTLTEATGITISNTGDLSLSANSLTASGQLVKKTDTVTVDATSAPNGYKLYLSTPTTVNTNRLYLSGNTSSPSYIKPNQTNNTDVTLGNETTLADNSWGFTNNSTNNNNSKYSAVPLSSSPALISSSTTATTKNQDVYYAVKANTSLPAGNYTGTVVYTALADIVEQKDTITSITPNYNVNQNSTQQVQIKVTFPVVIDSTSVLTNITTTIGGSTCTSPSYALSNDTSGNQKVLTVTCTAPTQSTAGAKDIVVSTEKGSFKYTFESGTTDTTKKYYYNSERGLTLNPSTYEGNESTTTSVTANFPAPVQDLGTTTAKLGSTTLSCTNQSTTTNATSTTLTMTCTITAQTSTSTQALTVTAQAFSDKNSNPIYVPSADFTYTYIPPYQKMQDFTITDCNNLAESTSTADNRLILMDGRDNKTYNIAKLADGNCWMVSNLALDGSDSNGNVRTLTPVDSDVTVNRTLAANILDGTSSNNTDVQIISKWAESSGCTGDYCVSGNIEKYGNFYNWYAATATTGTSSLTNTDAPDSVCPKGWKLPTGGEYDNASSAPDKSYGKLLYSTIDFSSASTSGSTGGLYVQKMQLAPLWFSFPGHYLAGLYSQATNGNYWSRKAYTSSSDVLILIFNSGGALYPQYYNSKFLGQSIRCVFDPPTPAMQDFTTSQCRALSTSTSTSDNRIILKDSRDNKEYKIAKLADGKCWMVENLALSATDTYGNMRTLTTADTDISLGEISSGSYTFSRGTTIGGSTSSTKDKPQIYGNYYNFTAVTLGIGRSKSSGDVSSSICPKGWKLPTSSGVGSFYNLGSAYSLNSSNVWSKIKESPLNFLASGYYNSSLRCLDTEGWYWARGVYSSDLAFALVFGNNVYYPYSHNYKGIGHSVRCVFGN